MAQYEKEIKVLNINVDEMENKLKSIGAIFKGEKEQKIYTYDIPTLYYRYLELLELLDTENKLLFNTNLIKLKTLLLELEDLSNNDKLQELYDKYNLKKLYSIIETDKDTLMSFLQDEKLKLLFQQQLINPNKWVRLRQSNDKVELTVKHVFEKENNSIQKVLETEINVSSLNEANLLLEGLGLARRNYQEKIRKSYEYEDAEIEIDIWPLLDPYMEIECSNEDTINKLVNVLELEEQNIVSLNTSQLYKEKGIDIQNMSELKFSE